MIRAAVLTEPNRPLQVEEVDLAAPGPGEVRVKVAAAGICHSDLHYMNGELGHPLPVVLGHEGAGTVVEVGSGVADFSVGDHVVLLWRTSCGHCGYCSSGRPHLCPQGNALRVNGTLLDGTSRLSLRGGPLHHFLGVSCFAEEAVLPQEGVVKVPDDVPLEIAAVCGCSVMTGVGAAMNSARVEPGSTVLVIGAGGVGLCAIMGARLCGAAQIIAADLNPSKLETAKRFGATDVVNSAEEDLPRAVRRLSGGGVEFAIEAIGRAETVAQAVRSLRAGGVAVAVGISGPKVKVELPLLDLVMQEKQLRGSVYGSTRPGLDFPRLFDLYRHGRLPLDELLSHRYRLEEINEAYAALQRGELTRAVVLLG
ncbi:MAG: zinc-binding dehydrogenase [Candidatus Dormibacteraceae bacterium]